MLLNIRHGFALSIKVLFECHYLKCRSYSLTSRVLLLVTNGAPQSASCYVTEARAQPDLLIEGGDGNLEAGYSDHVRQSLCPKSPPHSPQRHEAFPKTQQAGDICWSHWCITAAETLHKHFTFVTKVFSVQTDLLNVIQNL